MKREKHMDCNSGGEWTMDTIHMKFGTPTPVSFMEPGIDEPLEARFHGAADIREYDTSKFADEAAVTFAVRSGVTPIAQNAFNHWPVKEVVNSNKEELLASLLEEGFANIGIKASFVIATFMLTEESRQRYGDMHQKKITFDETSKQPKLTDLIPEEHGPLLEISYWHSSHGMAMGSGTSGSEDIMWKDDGSVIIETRDHRDGIDKYEKYLAGSEAAAKLRQYVKDAHLAEMAQVKAIPCPYQVTDYSSTAYMTLIFDDGRDGAHVEVTRRLDLGSYWKLQSEAVSGVYDIIKECKDTGTCLEKEESSYDIYAPGSAMPGFKGGGIGMFFLGGESGSNSDGSTPEPEKPSVSNAVTWKCSCGNDNSDTAKFCPECGSARPVEKWKCPTCGAENAGKFCAECGNPKPAPTWKCPNCGAENGGKFCSECGTPKPQ
jgi:membrane protease subunit (stomatin/prohibitin family)